MKGLLGLSFLALVLTGCTASVSTPGGMRTTTYAPVPVHRTTTIAPASTVTTKRTVTTTSY